MSPVKPGAASGELEIPVELATALASSPAARNVFDALSYSHRREHVMYVAEAKKSQTRERRAVRTIEALGRPGRTLLPVNPVVSPEDDALLPTPFLDIEDIVRELMKPMLREWLDVHLPPLIEKIVQRELRKVARRAMEDEE